MELMPGQICALELMPSWISAFKLPGIDARSNRSNSCIGIDARLNSVKNETIHVYKYNITFIDNILLKKNPTKLYNEAEVDLSSKSTSYIKLLQFWDFSIFSVFKVNFLDVSTDWSNTVLKKRKIKHTH